MIKKHRSFWETLAIVIIGVTLYWGLTKYKTVEHWLALGAEILSSFVIGIVIALILNVPMSFIEGKLFYKKDGAPRSPACKKISRPVSLLLTYVLCIGAVTAVLSLVIPSVKETMLTLYDQLPSFLNKVFTMAKSNPDINEWLNKADITQAKVTDTVVGKIKDTSIVSDTLGSMLSFASGTISGLTNFVIGIFFSVYMLAQKETLKNQLWRISTAYFPEWLAKKLAHVGNLAKNTFSSFISGQGLEACILGSLCFIGMTILQLPYAGTIGSLVALTAFIPIVGAFIGAAIGTFLILITSLKQALIFLAFLLILQQVENNLIYPRVVGSSVGLPSIWVLFAITVGGDIGGIFGMFVAVPVCSVLYCLLKDSVNSRNAKKAAKKAREEHRQRDLSNAPDWLGAVTDLPERSSDILTEYIGNPFSSDDEDPDPADDTDKVPVTDADETDTSEE